MIPTPSPLPTQFAPAERLSPEEIERQVAEMQATQRLRAVIDSIPNVVVVLNAERQILLGNSACEALAKSLQVSSFLGLRLGEFLNCHHAVCAAEGCGTTLACRTCGAVQAILSAAAGRRVSQECRIGTASGSAYDLRVTASPFPWEGQNYLLVVVGDISAEKRRQVLERIFFHDVLNTAGSISGIATIIADQPSLSYTLKDDLLFSAETLVNEIRAQRMLLAAENNELVLQPSVVQVDALLEHLPQLYRHHPGYVDRKVKLEPVTPNLVVVTDATILQRILTNMVKNALEATKPGEVIRLGADSTPDEVVFWCHNPGVIPLEDALQIFQRSFSTKGSNRGLGTYSMKLLGERYLGGKVSFSTKLGDGTRFQLSLPRERAGTEAPRR